MSYDVIDTHISLIKSGDTILHNGDLKTVTNSNISSGFMGMGICIFGDSYRLGTVPVKKVINLKG